MEKGRTVKNIPGEIRAVDIGNGICEIRKDPDVLCIIPHKKKRDTSGILFAVISVALMVGAIAAIIYLAPPIGTLLFALVAWCGFAGMLAKE